MITILSIDYPLRPYCDSKVSRRKVMLPAVTRFIFAQGHAKIWARYLRDSIPVST